MFCLFLSGFCAGWAKDQNPAFYGLTYAISSFVPVVMNPVLGWVSHATSIRTAMVGALAISIAGSVTVISAAMNSVPFRFFQQEAVVVN